MGLVAKWNVEGLIDKSPEVQRETKVFEELPGSAKRGTTLGEVVVRWTGSGSGRARSSQAGATTGPRCGRGCGLQLPASGGNNGKFCLPIGGQASVRRRARRYVTSTLQSGNKKFRAMSARTRREVSEAMSFVLFAALVVLGVVVMVIMLYLLARRRL